MGVVDNVMAAAVCVMASVWELLFWIHHNGHGMHTENIEMKML